MGERDPNRPPPQVWHVNDPLCPPDAVYCGRAVRSRGFEASPYANPIRIRKGRTSRAESIRLFCEHVLPTLDLTPLRGKDLKCWCKPAACHCDPILIKANAEPETAGRIEWGQALRVGVGGDGPTRQQRNDMREALTVDARRQLPPRSRYVLKEERFKSLSPDGFTWGACWYRHVDMDKVAQWDGGEGNAPEFDSDDNYFVERWTTP